MKAAITAILFLLAHGALAQTAPTNQAGATGICKDGSFTTAAAKDGACHGHKGVKTWYSVSAPSLPVPTPASSASLPVPMATNPATHTLPAPTSVSGASTSTLPAPSSATSVPSLPVATPGTASNSRLPTPTSLPNVPSASVPQPSQITVKPGLAAERARMAAMPPAAGGDPGMVWVNNSSKVYHCPGSDFYGKTKSGAYMTEADAKASGAHPNRNKPCI